MKRENILISIFLMLSLSIFAQEQPKLMIQSGYDSANDVLIITLVNSTNEAIYIRNDDGTGSSSLVLINFANMQGEKFPTGVRAFLKSVEPTKFVELSPRANTVFKFPLKNIRNSSPNVFDIAYVEGQCQVLYFVPSEKKPSTLIQKTFKFNAKSGPGE